MVVFLFDCLFVFGPGFLAIFASLFVFSCFSKTNRFLIAVIAEPFSPTLTRCCGVCRGSQHHILCNSSKCRARLVPNIPTWDRRTLLCCDIPRVHRHLQHVATSVNDHCFL